MGCGGYHHAGGFVNASGWAVIRPSAAAAAAHALSHGAWKLSLSLLSALPISDFSYMHQPASMYRRHGACAHVAKARAPAAGPDPFQPHEFQIESRALRLGLQTRLPFRLAPTTFLGLMPSNLQAGVRHGQRGLARKAQRRRAGALLQLSLKGWYSRARR